MKGPGYETSWNNMSRAALNAKNPKQTSHERKLPCNVSMYLQEKAPSNMCQWTSLQIYPDQMASTAYSRSLTKGVLKQLNSSHVTR